MFQKPADLINHPLIAMRMLIRAAMYPYLLSVRDRWEWNHLVA